MKPFETDKKHANVLWIIIKVIIHVSENIGHLQKMMFKTMGFEFVMQQNKVGFTTSLILIIVSILRNWDKGDAFH